MKTTKALLLFALLAALLAACGVRSGSEPFSPAGEPTAGAPDTGQIFFARPEGSKGRLIAYATPGGREVFTLPAGMASADGKLFASAALSGGEETALDLYDLDTGRGLASFELNGAWALGGLSPNGRWLALARLPAESEKRSWAAADRWQTDLQIIDGRSGEAVNTITLDGNFEIETVSADGASLFLIQHSPAVDPDRYNIRLYDLKNASLLADPLTAKGGDVVMTGYAWDGVASPDGKWLLTLYLNTARDAAFIHALNLVDKFPVCIDLPSAGGSFDRLKYYSLVLSRDGRRIYAVNAAAGVAAEVSLESLTLQSITPFAVDSAGEEAAPDSPTARSIISPDGRFVYFASGRNLWAYDTRARKVSALPPANGQIVGLGLSRDSRQLFAATLDGSVHVAALGVAAGNSR